MWICLQDLTCLAASGASQKPSPTGCGPSPIASQNHTAKLSCSVGCLEGKFQLLLSGTMCEHCELNTCPESTSYTADSPANRFPLPAGCAENWTTEISGRIPLASFEKSGPDTCSLKMCQLSLLADISLQSLKTWPSAGMMLDGVVYPLPPLEHHTGETDYGYSQWATPSAADAVGSMGGGQGRSLRTDVADSERLRKLQPEGASKTSGDGLATAVRRWPTPRATDGHGPGVHGRGGRLPDEWRTSNSITNSGWWTVEPGICRVVNGLPFRNDRIRALGNSVVPLCAKEAFKRLAGIE
jgi:hypothetical protein